MTDRRLPHWLAGYMEFTEGTESPPIFHQWVGLATLAGAMQRKMLLRFGHFSVYPNLYVVLVSPPGRARKSTALRIGQSLLEGVQDWGPKNIHFSTQSTSQAALVQQLSKIDDKTNQSLTAFSSELGSLLGSKSVEIIDFLVDIYDCHPNWSKQTVGRGLEKIEKPWLNMIAATTPQWMGDNLSKTAVDGGFVSRTLFIYTDERAKLIPFPQLTERQQELKTMLIADLAHVAELKGNFELDQEALDKYESWYLSPSRLSSLSDARLSSFFDREHIHMLKVAMIYSMARSDELVIRAEDIEIAIAALDDIKPAMARAFTSVGKNPFSTDMARIRDLLTRFPAGLTYKELFAATQNDLDPKQFDSVLNALLTTEDIAANGKRYYLARTASGS